MRKKIPNEVREKAVEEIERGEKTLKQIASEFGVTQPTICHWRDEYARKKQALKEPYWEKEREELYAEIGRLNARVTWLEKKMKDKLP